MRIKYVVHCALLAALAGCGTLANPFVHMKPDYTELPADTLREVAREVELAVQAGERDPRIPDRDGVVIDTELLRQSVRTRAARSEILNTLLDTGFAVEGGNGLVYILRTKNYKKTTKSKERDRNALIVMSENADRWALYEGVLKANDFSPRSLSAVQAIWHDARVAAMRPGQKYENAEGAVVRKGE